MIKIVAEYKMEAIYYCMIMESSDWFYRVQRLIYNFKIICAGILGLVLDFNKMVNGKS